VVLDDIDALAPPLQARLVRALQTRRLEPAGTGRARPLRARLLATTTVPLEEDVAAGRFRPDLFDRLSAASLRLPPLRERRAAIGPLSAHWLEEFTALHRPGVTGIHPEALRALCDYAWPGNVRQLRNVIERAVALAAGPLLELADLPEAIRQPDGTPGR
jgi:NtrC-family two-component system response regulator AlgB